MREFCSIDGCGRAAVARGLCTFHGKKMKRWGAPVRPKAHCSVEECEELARGHGLCAKHYSRWRRKGALVEGSPYPDEPEHYYTSVVLYHGLDACLIWPFHRAASGHAAMMGAEGELSPVGQRVCEFQNGPAPFPGARAVHSCGNGQAGCVARLHLRWARLSESPIKGAAQNAYNRGTRHGSHLLTEADVREIRRLRGKVSQRTLADRYGVSDGAIRAIYTGRNWGWLDADGSV